MIKQVIWSKLAHENRKSILQYWTIAINHKHTVSGSINYLKALRN